MVGRCTLEELALGRYVARDVGIFFLQTIACEDAVSEAWRKNGSGLFVVLIMNLSVQVQLGTLCTHRDQNAMIVLIVMSSKPCRRTATIATRLPSHQKQGITVGRSL